MSSLWNFQRVLDVGKSMSNPVKSVFLLVDDISILCDMTSHLFLFFTDDNREEKGDAQVKDEVKDNRNIVDSNCAQNLSGEDIDEMKRSDFIYLQDATGVQIIEALIANSSTFEKKTSFSQVGLFVMFKFQRCTFHGYADFLSCGRNTSSESRKNMHLSLAYLHEGLEPKVVHRDVKSSNILLDRQWNAKVSDFGLAKLLFSERSYVTTRAMGTYGYVAPEYACTGMLNEKSDIYSFVRRSQILGLENGSWLVGVLYEVNGRAAGFGEGDGEMVRVVKCKTVSVRGVKLGYV
ncbi:hypothetical protein Syun_004630 [Stephania yunnanensis]|uniref:Protein kinase domain-containing protein n=1 Tax=Stephania yunnanensis TaxID=152371 RepID=A0AAP0L4U2_9MAGN